MICSPKGQVKNNLSGVMHKIENAMFGNNKNQENRYWKMHILSFGLPRSAALHRQGTPWTRLDSRENFLAVLIVTGLIDYPEGCEKTLLEIGRK